MAEHSNLIQYVSFPKLYWERKRWRKDLGVRNGRIGTLFFVFFFLKNVGIG